MSAAALIDGAAARAAIEAGALAVDCRFDLADPARGERDYARAHLPGAVYAHLDRDLADLSIRGRGRHPLPSAAALSRTLSRWGVRPQRMLIAYDDGNGAYAARLWWMLRLVGHSRVSVLDGGYAAWIAAGLPVDAKPARLEPIEREIVFDRAQIVESSEVIDAMGDTARVLIDARGPVRFRGEQEPIDPVAGHVPGAINRPFTDNLGTDGRFKSPAQLRGEFERLLAGRAPNAATLMCGSGVTACQNLLAMHHAGLVGARIYAGSWSEWISDPARPVAVGPR